MWYLISTFLLTFVLHKLLLLLLSLMFVLLNTQCLLFIMWYFCYEKAFNFVSMIAFNFVSVSTPQCLLWCGLIAFNTSFLFTVQCLLSAMRPPRTCRSWWRSSVWSGPSRLWSPRFCRCHVTRTTCTDSPASSVSTYVQAAFREILFVNFLWATKQFLFWNGLI